ncbi:MAG: hypothetical protein H7Y01_09250 [Ferruginibacter sp.]|nr:hypothetical protein [Chitinophagaceae bacterium]
MKSKQKIYTIFQRGYAVFMILALLWLTVSAPFVFASQHYFAQQDKIADSPSPFSGTEEETANPFSGTTEEKAPGSTTFSEEYLHDNHKADYFFSILSVYHKCENAGTYVAFHGELLVPPPNAA